MGKILKNAVVTFLILILGTSTALLAYLHFFASGDSDFTGEWTADVDVTKQAAVTALDWLQDIEAVSVSMEDMESYMPNLTIQVNLTMEQTARMEGTFSTNIRQDSYDACNQAAYEAFANGFRELLGERLRMAGYEGGTEQEDVETLVVDAFGMSTVSYLMTYGPELLPSLEDLQAQYDGSGTYEADEGILAWRFEDRGQSGTRAEYYIRKDANLVLSGEADSGDSGLFSDCYPMIYTLQ